MAISGEIYSNFFIQTSLFKGTYPLVFACTFNMQLRLLLNTLKVNNLLSKQLFSMCKFNKLFSCHEYLCFDIAIVHCSCYKAVIFVGLLKQECFFFTSLSHSL